MREFKDVQDLKYMLDKYTLQGVLDMLAVLLEEQVADQGLEQMQETFAQADCLRNLSEVCK